jgi:hypothetical protein
MNVEDVFNQQQWKAVASKGTLPAEGATDTTSSKLTA